MKGRPRPTIILRFKSDTTTLPPPLPLTPRPATVDMSSNSSSSNDSSSTSDASSNRAGSGSGSSDEGEAMTAMNNAKRKREHERDIPVAIGGGKGNLFLQHHHQQLKRQRRGVAAVMEMEMEEGRVLRSHDVEKRGEYEEWFEEPERGCQYSFHNSPRRRRGTCGAGELCADAKAVVNDDIQMPIVRRDTHDVPRTPTRSPLPGPTAAELLDSPSKNVPAIPTHIARIRNTPIQTIFLEEELQKSGVRPPRYTTDPLADSMYLTAHSGADRLEKRTKNIERDLLHHNAAKIEGDLEKLRGPEWWKAIGLSHAVVTTCTKKELVKRREPLVKHLEATLEKYKAWNNSEKRKKHGWASNSPKGSQERDSYDGTGSERSGGGGSGRLGSHEDGAAGEEDDGGEEDGEEDGNDLRRRPTKKRAPAAARKGGRRTPPPATETKSHKKQPPKSVKSEPEFVSFYSTPSARLQAISNNRRKSSRMQTAFGVPLPVMEEKEFQLPEELLASTSAARHARARKRLSR